MITALVIAQYLTGLAWLSAAFYYAPSAWRVFRGRADALQVFSAIFFFVGVTQAGFILRWMLWSQSITAMSPTEINLWLALYIASTVEAMALIAGSVFFRRWTTPRD